MTPKPKQVPKKAAKKTGRKTGVLVRQPHGGALLNGMAPNHVPGPGRPKDEVREKLLGLANGKGFDFLAKLMDGEIQTTLIGKCPSCSEEAAWDPAAMDLLMDRIKASVDQRLKGLDLSLKYGAGTKDEVNTSEDKQRYELMRQCLILATIEITKKDALSEQILTRADAMYQEKSAPGAPT